MELTYEGLRRDLNREIEKKEVAESGQYLERQFESGRMSPGEPANRHTAHEYDRGKERLLRLRDWSRDLDEREERGVPLGHPQDDVFVEQLLEMIE